MMIMNDLEWSMLSYYVIYLNISEKSCSKQKKEALSWSWDRKNSMETVGVADSLIVKVAIAMSIKWALQQWSLTQYMYISLLYKKN